jgi:hypothetical protein
MDLIQQTDVIASAIGRRSNGHLVARLHIGSVPAGASQHARTAGLQTPDLL